jgi:nucleoside-diphosphate-sugar epimerase
MNLMNTIFILGENSFIAKHLYIKIKVLSKYKVILLNHNNYHELKEASNNDIVINFCGMNRATSEIEYEEANHKFLQKIISSLANRPFFIHVSSLMVYGFENKNINALSNYQQWFITSKLNGEQYLRENYPEQSLCIIRPSNIYGYDCTPYYNNLLSTLVYEKICGLNKINNINTNCFRNMLSVDNLTTQICDLISEQKFGTYNVMSDNTVSLDVIIKYIYNNDLPEDIVLNNGEQDIPNTLNKAIIGNNIIINEDLHNKIKLLEEDMRIFIKLKGNIPITTRNMLTQPRGNMVEISSLNSKRLYKITLTQNSVRGNHYHYAQIEEFYTNKDKVLYLFAYADNPSVIYQYISHVNDLIIVNPTIIHTLTNDFVNNNPEIIISSTQEFIADNIPDTEYINIL